MSAPDEPSQESNTNVFDLSRRGYDRDQVDDQMRTLLEQLAGAEDALQQERERAERAEAEIRGSRSEVGQQADGPAAASAEGFGHRLEKLMRAAENEASEVRASASREAGALLEQARNDAETHRHEVEQSLIERSTALDQKAAHRRIELDEREKEMSEHVAAARQEVERLLSDARTDAERIERDAQTRARDHRAQAEKAIRERHEAAESELFRLRGLADDVRGDLKRLMDSLTEEFDGVSGGGRRARPSTGQPQPSSSGARGPETSETPAEIGSASDETDGASEVDGASDVDGASEADRASDPDEPTSRG